jgi:pyrrolidone-carboxylate peptidase
MEEDEVVVIVTGFGRFKPQYVHDKDNPSNLLALEVGNQIRELAKRSIAHKQLTCDVIRPIAVDWDNIQTIVHNKLNQYRGKTIIWIAFGAADEFRIETIGNNERSPRFPDARDRIAGSDGGPDILNDPRGNARYRIHISQEAIDAIIAALKRRGIKIRTSADAGRYICESTAYSLYQADHNGHIAAGIFIHTPPTLSPDERSEFAKRLIEQLIKHLNYRE